MKSLVFLLPFSSSNIESWECFLTITIKWDITQIKPLRGLKTNKYCFYCENRTFTSVMLYAVSSQTVRAQKKPAKCLNNCIVGSPGESPRTKFKVIRSMYVLNTCVHTNVCKPRKLMVNLMSDTRPRNSSKRQADHVR